MRSTNSISRSSEVGNASCKGSVPICQPFSHNSVSSGSRRLVGVGIQRQTWLGVLAEWTLEPLNVWFGVLHIEHSLLYQRGNSPRIACAYLSKVNS